MASDLLLSFAVFATLTFLLFSTANTLIWRYFSQEMRDVLDWAMLFFLFTTTEILLVLGASGFLGAFSLQGMALGTVLCFVLGAVPLPWLGRGFQLGFLEAWNRLRQLLFRQDRDHGQEWIWAIFGFLILYGAVEFFNALVQYPWEYDTLAYHMPILVEWLQSGTLWDIFYAAWGGPLGYYPSNHELLLGWLVLPFGRDYLVNLANFWIVGMLVIVVFKILREMGVKDFLAWLAGALIMVMPIFLRQLGTGQVDLLMAVGVLMSWYYFLRSYQRRDGYLLIPVLLNIAILLGTKYLAVIYSIPIFIVLLLMIPHWRVNHSRWWLWTLVILGSLGSMWYWRNLVLTSNPIFPAELRIQDWLIFEGYQGLTERIRDLSLWSRFTVEGEWREWLMTMTKETGWHLYLVVLAYVLLIVEMVSKLFFGQMKRGEGKIYTLMLFFLPAYIYLYFIAPYTASMMEHNVRYAMPWLMLAMIMVAYVAHKVGAAQRVLIIALLGLMWWQFLTLVPAQRSGDQAFLELSFVQQYPWLCAQLFATLVLLFVFFEAWRRRRWWRFPIFVLVFVAGFSSFQAGVLARDEQRAFSWQHKYDFPLMKVYAWLDEHAPFDARIASSLNPLYYPLYGRELERPVRYININACGDCDYAAYQAQNMTLRDQPDYESWKKNLEAFGADYLVLGYSIRLGLEQVIPWELEWTKSHPEHFERVFQEGEVTVYRLK